MSRPAPIALAAHRRRLAVDPDVLLLAGVLGIVALVRWCFTRSTLEDEIAHLPQIERFCRGDFTLIPDLTTIPGYHAVLATIATILGTHSLEAMRTVNVAIAMATIGVTASLLRAVRGRLPAHRLLQSAFFPIAFPYYFLVYTDVFALLLVLVALRLALADRHRTAALVGIASMLVRQTDVVWVAMLPVLAYVVRRGRLPLPRDGGTLLRSGWLYAVGIAGFAAFVSWNGGVALGDVGSHPAFTVHTGNVYFFLLLYALFFAPGIAARLRASATSLREPFVMLAFAALLATYLLAYATDHPYNNFRPEFFLRNRILMAIAASPALKVAVFVPIALAALDLGTTAAAQPAIAVVAACTVLVLVPSWLVEHRYDIIPFALLLLFRRDDGPAVETSTTLAYVTVAMLFVYGIQNDWFFL
jgi:alpha-1,2-glucosyltransferase